MVLRFEFVTHMTAKLIHPRYIEKIIPESARYISEEEFYDRNGKPATLINLFCEAKLGRINTHLKLIPYGYSQGPSSSAELKSAILDVLNGLKWLHDRSFVNRDVRWPNVL